MVFTNGIDRCQNEDAEKEFLNTNIQIEETLLQKPNCIEMLMSARTYPLCMATYKVSEIYFKQNTGAIEKVIGEEAKDGWELHTLSTYSSINDGWKKAHAVIVFSKD